MNEREIKFDIPVFDFNKPPAIVYPAYAVNSYAVIRSLGIHGIPIIALDKERSPTFKSRWVKPLISPDANIDPRGFIEFLVELGKKLNQKAVLFMMNDLYAYMIIHHYEKLAPYYYYNYISLEVMDNCLDKYRMSLICDTAGVPQPRTAIFKKISDVSTVAEHCGFPCIVKPLIARFSYDGVNVNHINAFPDRFKSKAVRANSIDELSAIFKITQEISVPICVQEEIQGPPTNLYTVNLCTNEHSEIVAAFCGHKLRQFPPDFGTVTLGKSIIVPELIELSRKFIKEIKYRGMAGLEFKYDPRDKQYKFLEINPRDGQWIALALASGVNLPLIAYRQLIGEDIPAYTEQISKTKKWLDIRDDFEKYYLKYRKADDEHKLTFFRWLWGIIGADIEAIWNLRDPIPGTIRLLSYLKSKACSIVRKVFRKNTGI